MVRRISLSFVLPFVLAFACGTNAAAQTYPAKPLRMVVPLPPGATTDVVMRATALELAPRIGQPIVVENHPGGNWVIGAQACLRAGADPHSLCVVNSDTLSFNVHVLNQVPYDPARDFTPVTNLFFLLEGLIARGNLPAANASQLQAYAKQKSGGANMATLGPGSSPDVFRQWLNQHWASDLVGIPYKGGNQVVAAVLAGEVDVAKIGMGNLAGQLKSDKVKFLAIQGTRRSRLLPEVPTLTEAGLGGYSVRVWWGLMMNAGVPDAATRRINAEFNKLYREPKTAEYLENAFVEVAVGSTEEFAAFLTADRQRAAEVVKQFNIPRN